MWILEERAESSQSENKGFLLTTSVQHVVGRKECTILVPDDASISRKHSVVTVQHDKANLVDPSKMSKVFLEDFSKYGTFINGVKISGKVNVKDGDEILFGKNDSHYRLKYTPLVVVTSCLDEKKKNTLKSHIYELGGHMISDWSTNTVSHLVMDGLTFTIKVIHALAECCPIVTPSFFDDVINSVNTASTPPPLESSYLPPLKEETISSQGASFLPREARKSLFYGKTFIFISKKQHKRLHRAVISSGGSVLLRDLPGSESDDGLLSKNVCVMMIDSKEQNTLPAESQSWVLHVTETLRRHGCRPIPESELGLALLFVSMNKYCNPSITAVPTLTQNLVSQSFQAADIMSQQMVTHAPQFKKPFTPAKQVKQDETDLAASQSFQISLNIKSFTSEDRVIEPVPESQTYSQERPPPAKRRKLPEPDGSPTGSRTSLGEVPESIDMNKSVDEAVRSNLQLKLAAADSFVADSLEVKDGAASESDEELKRKQIRHERTGKVESIRDSLDVSNPFSAGETADIKGEQEEMAVEHAQGEEMNDQIQQQVTNKETADQHIESKHVPAGFLGSKMPRKIKKETLAVFEDEEANLPRDLVVVDQVALIVRQANVLPTLRKRTENTAVKNFKKFTKQVYPGFRTRLPRIIGGGDLEVYQSSDRLEKDEWFLEAREVDAERQREERRAEELFRWEERPIKNRRTKR